MLLGATVAGMKHLTFSDKNLVLGDEAADLLVAYAAELARTQSADTVTINAYGADGDKVEATLLLDAGAPLMIETSHTDLAEPDNDEVVAYIRERMQQISAPTQAMPMDAEAPTAMDDFEKDYGSGSDGA